MLGVGQLPDFDPLFRAAPSAALVGGGLHLAPPLTDQLQSPAGQFGFYRVGDIRLEQAHYVGEHQRDTTFLCQSSDRLIEETLKEVGLEVERAVQLASHGALDPGGPIRLTCASQMALPYIR